MLWQGDNALIIVFGIFFMQIAKSGSHGSSRSEDFSLLQVSDIGNRMPGGRHQKKTKDTEEHRRERLKGFAGATTMHQNLMDPRTAIAVPLTQNFHLDGSKATI